jgi:class 3 adenylate cyclase
MRSRPLSNLHAAVPYATGERATQLRRASTASELPTATVTFLFTDVEGSTRAWDQHPAAMRLAMVRHDALIEAAVAEQDGVLVRPRGEGDSRFAAFAQATLSPAPPSGWCMANFQRRLNSATLVRIN